MNRECVCVRERDGERRRELSDGRQGCVSGYVLGGREQAFSCKREGGGEGSARRPLSAERAVGGNPSCVERANAKGIVDILAALLAAVLVHMWVIVRGGRCVRVDRRAVKEHEERVVDVLPTLGRASPGARRGGQGLGGAGAGARFRPLRGGCSCYAGAIAARARAFVSFLYQAKLLESCGE